MASEFEDPDVDLVSSDSSPPRAVSAVVGRRVEGAIVDPIVVQVWRDIADWGEPDDIAPVFNGTRRVYFDARNLAPLTVMVGDDPYIAVSGVDPLEFLNMVDEDFVTFDLPEQGAPTALTFGALPEGYEVIYNNVPWPSPASVGATMSVARPIDVPERRLSTYVDAVIQVGVIPSAIGRDATSVDIDGIPGWYITDGVSQLVTWQVDDDTFASVFVGKYSDEGEALEIARSLRWVSPEEWADHYDVELSEAPS